MYKQLKKFSMLFVVVTTILWSLGLSALIPQTAKAVAVTASGPFDLLPMSGGMTVMASSYDIPIFRFSLNKSSGGSETLSSVTVTVTSTIPANNAVLASHISQLVVFKDSNSNNYFDPQSDASAGTQTSVNVGSATTITTGSNNSLAADGALPTSFFVAIKTAANWTAGDSIYINFAADGIATSANSPTVTPITGSRTVSFGGDGGSGWSGFSVEKVTFVNASNVDVSFTDSLDLNSGNATSTANYTLRNASGVSQTISSIVVLPDNKSVRLTTGATVVSDGTWSVTVSNGVKNTSGKSNAGITVFSIMSAIVPLAISEIKIGSATDQYNEFIEVYNRSGGSIATSTVKLHFVNAAGTMDVNVPLTFLDGSVVPNIPSHKFLLIAPITSSASSTADAVYSTSTVASLVPGGAAYISNSAASSTAVMDKVCWGSHAVSANCEGSAASGLSANDGTSIERKAFNDSTSASMSADTNGNGIDTQNNYFDFVTRTTPESQNSRIALAENPTGGSYGGANNQAPSIQHAPVFKASVDTTLNLIARIFDDGGTVPSGNTQFIYCVTDSSTCTPASSTPIYGTNIGSSWYKFSATSTSWGTGKTLLKYYILATDSASPAKTKVITNDPGFDANTYDTTGTGIQTAALQQSKALATVLSSGNLGSASIMGTVNDSSSAAVSGATVWIDGTQFAATTGSDGTFSFANVGPMGGAQLKIAKDGYGDQSLSFFIPSSGLVSLPALSLYSGSMGMGGDFTQPKVASSFPAQGMMGFPTLKSDGIVSSIEINFDKAVDTTTFTTANVYLTEAGSGTHIAGSVAAGSATQVKFTPTSALTSGKNYTLFLTQGVKDSAGNPVMGNSPGGNYILPFSTSGGMYSSISDIGATFGTGNAFPAYVVGSQPAPGKQSVARNTKVFVTFSEAMQNSAANLANVKLYKVTNPFASNESKSLVTATNSIDSSNKIIIITPSSNLDVSSHYRVEVLGGIQSAKGIPLGNPGTSGYLTSVKYQADFDTSASATGDTSAPTVDTTIPADVATGISTAKPIIISFSESMNPSTVTDTSVVLKLGSTAVAGDLTYDPNNWMVVFVPDYSLTPTSTYTITVTTGVQDLAGNAMAATLLRTFTTGGADTSAPTVVSAQANDYALKIAFSKPMLAVSASDINYASSVLKPANYTIHLVNSAGATQATIATSTATITYDAASRSVALNGIAGIAANNLINISVSGVKDISFNNIAADSTAAVTTTAYSSAKTGGFTMGGGMGMMGPQFDAGGNMMQGGMMGGPPAMVGTFMESGIGFAPGVKVYPFNSMANVSTIYGVEIPLSYQIPNAGFIDIAFPDGADVTNAKKDTDSPPNNDLNGPGSGVVVFGTSEGTLPSGWTTGGASSDGVIVNTDSRIVRVILGAVATRRGTGNLTSGDGDQHDFLRLDIAQIVNPTTATKIGMSGNSATVTTKKADGTVLETLSSGSFFTSAAGSFTVRGRVLAGASGINGINVFLMSPMTGPQSTSTATGRFNGQTGEFMFQNLVAGNYMLGAEQFAKSGATNYTAGFPASINVNSTNCSSDICSKNLTVVDASTGVSVTLSISGTFSNNAIDIFAGGPGSFRKTTSTLDGALTNDTSNSIKLNANGVWMVGFGPQMSTEIFGKGGPSAPTTWMPPKPQEVQVSGCPDACATNPTTLTFNVSAANKTIKFSVKDASSNAIANANVFAYSPASNAGNDTMANADGTGSINLSYGTYKIGASVSGMPGGVERSILVKDDGGTDKVFVDGSSTGIALSSMTNASLILTISKPSYTISGQVTDGTNPVANAPVSAYRTDGPGHSETFTNSSGNYTLYVANGTWKVQAFVPDYGKLPEQTVTISGSSSSGKNFEPNTSSVNYATVTKSVGNDTDADGVLDSGEGTSNVQMIVEGTTGDLNNDGDTSDSGENVSYVNSGITDTNGSSTLKLPPGTYTMKAYSPIQGEMSSSTQSVVVSGAGTVTTVPYDILAPKTGAVTINILDSDGNATSSMKAVVEFMQIGGKSDKTESFSGTASSTISLHQYDVANALNAVTSTNPTNMYLLDVTIPGVSDSNLIVYGADSNTVLATSTAATGYWKVEIDANTESINIKLPALNYVNGTVKDAAGNAVPDATVYLENSSTGEKMDVQANTSGNYSTKLSSATYLISATKDGYIDTASSVAVSASGALADSATTMTVAAYTISGTITAGSSAASGATVRAEKLGGGIVTATTGSDGTYSLKVINGNWKVSAAADGYTESTHGSIVAVSSANVSSINITLSTTATSLSGSTSQSVTPQNGGSMNDSSAGASVKASEAALSSSANPYSMNDKEISNVVGGNAGTPVSGEAKTINSYDNDGNTVTLLNDDVAVSASYSNSDMTTALGTLTLAKLGKVQMGSWDDTADNWQTLPTTIAYKDSSGKFIEPSTSASTVAYTGQTSHFSSFNPIVPSDGVAPSIITNVAAVAGNNSVSLTWTAGSEGDLQGYDVYRSTSPAGTYSSLGSSTSNSYTDSTAVNGTTYYYKITATDTGGLESDLSSASNAATPTGAGSGGAGGGGSASSPPVLGAVPVSVDGDAAKSSQIAALKFSVSNAVQMAISENADFSGVAWESYSSTKKYTLSSGLGAKKIYVKFRSASGETTAIKTVDITVISEATAEEKKTAEKSTAVEKITTVTCSLAPGSAYKLKNSAAVFYITPDCAKRPFNKANVFFTYFTSWSDVKTVTAGELNNLKNDTLGFMPWGPKYDPKYGALVKIVSDPKVYLLLGDKKYWIISEDVFNALSYKWNWIEDIDEALLAKYQLGEEITDISKHPSYTLIKYKNSAKVYRLEPDPKDAAKQVKRYIKDEAAFNTLTFRWDRIVTIDSKETYADGETLTAPASVKKTDSGVYKFSLTLQQGDSGTEVTKLQEKLKALGYLSVEPTGTFGAKTKEAVVKLQQAYKLSPYPGVVGKATRDTLNGL